MSGTSASDIACSASTAVARRILMLTTSGHLYEGAGGRVRIASETKLALKAGYDCKILCIVPIRHGATPQLVIRAVKSLEEETGAKVSALPMCPGRRMLPRASLWADSFLLRQYLTRVPTDIIHAHGCGACVRALIGRKDGWPKVICDFHGAPREEYLYSTEGRPTERVLRMIEQMEAASILESDGSVYVSQAMQSYYAKRLGSPGKNFAIVPCATWMRDLPYELRVRRRHEMDIDDKFVFVYAGSYRRYQRLDRICDLFAEAMQAIRHAYLLVLTNHVQEFRQALQGRGLDPSRYTIVSLRHDDVAQWLIAGDCGLLLRDDSMLNRVSSPTKFAEYLAAGVPVILEGTIGDYNSFVREKSVGVVIERGGGPERLWQFCEDVRAQRREYWQRTRLACREHLSWETAGGALLELYETVLRPCSPCPTLFQAGSA